MRKLELNKGYKLVISYFQDLLFKTSYDQKSKVQILKNVNNGFSFGFIVAIGCYMSKGRF